MMPWKMQMPSHQTDMSILWPPLPKNRSTTFQRRCSQIGKLSSRLTRNSVIMLVELELEGQELARRSPPPEPAVIWGRVVGTYSN